MSSGVGTESRVQSAPDREREGTPWRRQWPVLAGLGVALLSLAAAAWILTQSGSDVGSNAETPVGTPLSDEAIQRTDENPPSGFDQAEIDAAKQRFTEYLALRDELYRDPSASMARVYDYAMGREIDVMGGTLAAFRIEQTSFSGDTTVASLAVSGHRSAQGAAALHLRACLVPPQELKNGRAYRNPNGYYGPSLMDVSMGQVGGRWFIERTFLGKEALRPC